MDAQETRLVVDSSTSTAQPKKRRTNVGKACEPCRRRRCKCDGVKPSCTTCAVYKDDCYWESREDYRKPLSRQQVQALTTRVQDLERLLREHGLDPGAGGMIENPEFGEEAMSEHKHKTDVESSGDLREWSQEHLVEAESGDVQVHGPTSAFRHLGKYSSDRHEDNVYDDTRSDSPDSLPNGFARYLPKDVFLTEEQHDQVIDRFLMFYASWGQRTHPILFRRDMRVALNGDGQTKTSSYSPMLHNAILAIALGFSDEKYLRLPETRKVFARKAKDFIDTEGMKPSVATVQALAHLASYHSLAAEHNLGWLYIGMALRCGVASLPPTIDIELDQLIWENRDHVTELDAAIKPQPGMISTTFIHTVKLMRIGERIMNTLYGIKADMSTLLRTGVVSEISLSLSTWLGSLPPPLTYHNHSPKNGLPHILMLHLSHAWLVILLHRPFYRPLAGLPSGAVSNASIPTVSSTAAWAVKQCDRAALHVISLLQTWHRLHNLRFCPPTAIQCCFIAGTTHLLALASALTPKKQAEALARAQTCIDLMTLMAVSWPAAHHQQLLLENLLEEYGVSVSSNRSSESSKPDDMKDDLTSVDPMQFSGPQSTLAAETGSPTFELQPTMPNASPDFDGIFWSQPPSTTTASTSIEDLSAWTGTSITTNAAIPGQALGQMQSGILMATDLPYPANEYSAIHPTEWDSNTFELDRETQALLDNILRPHLDVMGPYDLRGNF